MSETMWPMFLGKGAPIQMIACSQVIKAGTLHIYTQRPERSSTCKLSPDASIIQVNFATLIFFSHSSTEVDLLAAKEGVTAASTRIHG